MLLSVIRYFSLSPSPSLSSSLSRARLNCGQAGLRLCVCLMSMVFFFQRFYMVCVSSSSSSQYRSYDCVFLLSFAAFFSPSSSPLISFKVGVVMARYRSFFSAFFAVSFHEPNSLSIECVCINSPQNFTSL